MTVNSNKNNDIQQTVTPEEDGQGSVNLDPANSDGFPDRMNVLIKAIGSASEVARKCGFSEGVVRSWRDGKSDPSRDRCIALAKGTGASLLWIVAGEGPMWASEIPPQSHSQSLRLEIETIVETIKLLRWAFKLEGAEFDPVLDWKLLEETYEFVVSHDGKFTPDNLVDFSKRLAERRAQKGAKDEAGEKNDAAAAG